MRNELFELIENGVAKNVTHDLHSSLGQEKIEKLIKDTYNYELDMLESYIFSLNDSIAGRRSIPTYPHDREKATKALNNIDNLFAKWVRDEDRIPYDEYLIYDITKFVKDNIIRYHKLFTAELKAPLFSPEGIKFLWFVPYEDIMFGY